MLYVLWTSVIKYRESEAVHHCICPLSGVTGHAYNRGGGAMYEVLYYELINKKHQPSSNVQGLHR